MEAYQALPAGKSPIDDDRAMTCTPWGDSVVQQLGVQVVPSVDALLTCAMHKDGLHCVASARKHVRTWVYQLLCADE